MPSLAFPAEPSGALSRWPPPSIRSLLATLVTHPVCVPFITAVYSAPFLLLWAKATLLRLLKGQKPLRPVAPSDAVAAALMNKKHGTHKYIQANGLRFHYVEKGSPSASSPLVLFLHGYALTRPCQKDGVSLAHFFTSTYRFPEFWYSWRNQLHWMATHSFHAVALDMRGYGWTEKPKGAYMHKPNQQVMVYPPTHPTLTHPPTYSPPYCKQVFMIG